MVEDTLLKPAAGPDSDGPGDAGGPDEQVVVEVAVRRADAARTAARLRADGHRVLGVRPGDTTGAGR
jgi:hypothetical protein